MHSDIVVISENLFQILMLDAIMKGEAQFKRSSEFLEVYQRQSVWAKTICVSTQDISICAF